jgi:hypothetical protein
LPAVAVLSEGRAALAGSAQLLQESGFWSSAMPMGGKCGSIPTSFQVERAVPETMDVSEPELRFIETDALT